MFLNHRPLLVLLLFLAASPVDVVTKVLYSEVDGNPDGYPDDDDNERIAPSALDLNPLHILCPVCSLLQFLVGGLLSGLLGNNLLKQVGILVCSLVVAVPLHLPFLPNIICTVVFEIIFILLNKTGNGLCPLLLLCPMKKKAVKPPTEFASAEEEYEDRIANIIENRDSANLSPQYEFLYKDLIASLPLDKLKGTGVEEPARHVLRNLIAAIEYHVAHREEYLAARAANAA